MKRQYVQVGICWIAALSFVAQAIPPLEEGDLSFATGRLAIQAVQGTPEGPPIADTEVTVELIHRGVVVHKRESRLDQYGVLVLENLPIGMGVQPVVRVAHDGVTYQQTGNLMDAAHAQQTITVTCYELTENEPGWTIQMRHVMLKEDAKGLSVTEIIQIDNPDTRTWVGSPSGMVNPPTSKQRTTTSFALSPGVGNITLGNGFHDWCCTTFDGGVLTNHLPLMPQITEMTLTYILPVVDNQVSLQVVAPVATAHLMLMIPEVLTTVSTRGLEFGGTQLVGDTVVRFYTGNEIGVDDRVGITVTGFGPKQGRGSKSVNEQRAQSGEQSDKSPVEDKKEEGMSAMKMVAALGGGLILLIAVIVIFLKTPPSPDQG